ncbi:hypothetical protein KEM52_006460 [Ascosphaera acerosa]|nr:hypothetical protein KEM52_006460 [Ascosphaera acerosa]
MQDSAHAISQTHRDDNKLSPTASDINSDNPIADGSPEYQSSTADVTVIGNDDHHADVNHASHGLAPASPDTTSHHASPPAQTDGKSGKTPASTAVTGADPDEDGFASSGGLPPPSEDPPTKIGCLGRGGSITNALASRKFYLILLLGQCFALGITGTNTFSTLLVNQGTSIPAFQSFFNYILLNLVYTPYTIYRYGWRGWLRLVLRDGWKYLIFAFCDVEGNYFVVLSYDYTTILSAQLINFWAIAMVVLVSFLLLKVKYHWAQIAGILVCIGGMGVLFGSDHITGSSSSDGVSTRNQIKGDIFALIGATFYGLTNVTEEYFVSTRPMYEVLGQLGLYGMCINGVQAGIFDRKGFRDATWNSKVGGYFAGYTIVLFCFYSFAPLLFRLASAAFFNISLLTANFWGVVVGVKVFHYHIHWMYPIAFVLIIVGQLIYFVGRQVFGDESFKPWLGENQEKGVDGIGTAKHNATRERGRRFGLSAIKDKLRRPPAPAVGAAAVSSQVDVEAGVPVPTEAGKYGTIEQTKLVSTSPSRD